MSDGETDGYREILIGDGELRIRRAEMKYFKETTPENLQSILDACQRLENEFECNAYYRSLVQAITDPIKMQYQEVLEEL